MRADRWYYQHMGQAHGPISVDELRYRRRTGSLRDQDLIWPEGLDCQMTFATWEAKGFSFSPTALMAAWPPAQPPSAPLPDWLGDVRRAEQSGVASSLPAKISVSDWLE